VPFVTVSKNLHYLTVFFFNSVLKSIFPFFRNRPRIVGKAVAKPRPCVQVKPRTIYEDTIQTYHTEDTPANISHAGSNSDLSILTVPDINQDCSGNSSDTDNILNECIHSGMPQVLYILGWFFCLLLKSEIIIIIIMY